MTDLGFRAPAAVHAAGVTYRQLDYWARTQLVTPSVRPAGGCGTQRLYSRDDIVRLAVLRSLLELGLSLPMLREFLPVLMREGFVELTHGRWTVARLILDPYAVAASVDERLAEAIPERLQVVSDSGVAS